MTKRPRVVVAVEPRLLADALARALRHDDIEVIILDDAEPLIHLGDVDVAVVNIDLPPRVTAAATVRVASDPATAGGGGTPIVDIVDIAERVAWSCGLSSTT